VDADMRPGECAADRYRRQLRDLLVAGLDLSRVPCDPPPTQNPALLHDFLLAAEHYSETHLGTTAPTGAEARAVWTEVATDILACLERGEWGRLRPPAWAVRAAFRWWFEMSWFDRVVYRLRGGRGPRPGGRPLREVVRAEPGAPPDRGGLKACRDHRSPSRRGR
jgi:hypothetical protein